MVKLYSTHCPKCNLLEKQLLKQNIEFEVIDDKDVMIAKGFQSAPKLEINGEILDYNIALKWVMNGGKK